MQVTTLLTSAGMLLLSAPAVIMATAVQRLPSLVNNSADASDMPQNSSHDNSYYNDDHFDSDVFYDDGLLFDVGFYDDQDDLPMSSHNISDNSTHALSPRAMTAPYRIRVPDTWSRACMYTAGKNPYAAQADIVQVYARDFDLHGGNCGQGLIDNLHHDDSCGRDYLQRILYWQCRRIDKTGISVSFKINNKQTFNSVVHNCVEIAFATAAAWEGVPTDIVCCNRFDYTCLNEAPGHDPRDNLLIPSDIWIGPGPAPTNFPGANPSNSPDGHVEPMGYFEDYPGAPMTTQLG